MKIKVQRSIVKYNSVTVLPKVPNNKRENSTPRNLAVLNPFAVTIFIQPVTQTLIMQRRDDVGSPNL